MTPDEQLIVQVSVEATAIFAEGIADVLGPSLSIIQQSDLVPDQYKQGYSDAVEDVQKLLRNAAKQQREKLQEKLEE